MMILEPFKEKREKTMERRRFLKWMGALGLGLTPLVWAAPVREKIFGRGLASAAKTRPLMGTFVTVTVLHPSQDKAFEAMEKAFAEMERLIHLLNRHAPDTPVSYLNRVGYLTDIPPEIHEVVGHAERLHRLTHGAFDITVKPILDLLETCFSRNLSAPSAEEIRMALRRIGVHYLVHQEKEMRFLQEGMGITLDGIAKGYIVDRAVSQLKGQGIQHALVNAGGDILALGGKGDDQPWRIAIQDPRDRNRIVGIIPLREGALATSGDYENFFDPEKKFHHIINPETGLSPQQFSSVSVRTSSLTVADALATAAFIPSLHMAKIFLQSISGAEALWIDQRKVQTRSPGWKWV